MEGGSLGSGPPMGELATPVGVVPPLMYRLNGSGEEFPNRV